MVMKLRYGEVAGFFERVVKSDSTKDGGTYCIQPDHQHLRNIVLCDITNTSVLSHISFSLAQLIVLFRSFFFWCCR